MGREPAESVPLTDVYVCRVMEPDDPTAPLPKLRWSLFADQSPAAAVGMPAMGGAGDYHTICGPVLARTTRGAGRRLHLGRREHLVARVSTDGGRTWPRRLVVEPSYAGYSTLIESDGERVGIAYDRHPRLSYRTFYLEDCT